jgi:hypothetical protein
MTAVSDVLQRMGLPHLVPLGEFIVSPGVVGAAVVVAAVLVLCVVLYGSRRARKRFEQELEQRERHHEWALEDAQHAAAVARCWERWRWVVETAGIEPAASEGAALGLEPEVALALVRGLLRDAEQIGDDTLAEAVALYYERFVLVLAQQGGPLSGLAMPEPPSLADGKPDTKPPSSAGGEPEAATAPPAEESSSATIEERGERRRRR